MAGANPTVPPVDHEGAGRVAPGPDAPDEVPARDAMPERSARWGASVAAMGLMMVIAGIAMLGFPFLLDFTSGAAGANLMVCGGITIFLGVLRLVGVRHPAIGVTAAALGIWLFASSFFLGELAEEAWSERCLGAVVFFLGLMGLTRPTPEPTVEAPTSDLR